MTFPPTVPVNPVMMKLDAMLPLPAIKIGAPEVRNMGRLMSAGIALGSKPVCTVMPPMPLATMVSGPPVTPLTRSIPCVPPLSVEALRVRSVRLEFSGSVRFGELVKSPLAVIELVASSTIFVLVGNPSNSDW